MKVCKRLYFAFLSLGCKDSKSTTSASPSCKGELFPVASAFWKKSEKASTGDERPKMTFWAREEPALHWKA